LGKVGQGYQGLEGEDLCVEAHKPASFLHEAAATANRQSCVWKDLLIPDTTSLYLVSHTQSTATATVFQSGTGGIKGPVTPNKEICIEVAEN